MVLKRITSSIEAGEDSSIRNFSTIYYAEELVLVTNNRDDFVDLVSGVELHPGLVVILENVRRNDQIVLFDLGLKAISKMPSLINKVVEIDADGAIRVSELPEIR